ncbi:hypothetical protein [Arthrobacter sp. UM1]|uniref:hypothetical protein n=1 Tax=Arthrobacter sp. UM1 TaxID=2766776 RepID=UPI001CF7096C|nr:hypothetical protein [Arthrobacter sp. UM1]MCB4208182.1 hypothetical protein [Arthrobacter sp. UM1]
MVLITIIACEVSFWVLLVAGLAARYLFRRKRLGAALLIAAPVVDLVLLGVTAVDLRRGAEPTFAHSLAALYIGGSIAFGHSIVRWMDNRWAARHEGAPLPPKPTGRAHSLMAWKNFGLGVIAAGISWGLLLVLEHLALDGVDVTALTSTHDTIRRGLVIGFVIALSYTIWPRKAEDDDARDDDHQPGSARNVEDPRIEVRRT